MRYRVDGAISPAQTRFGWTKEVVPMEQFLLQVLADVLAGIVVMLIERKFFR